MLPLVALQDHPYWAQSPWQFSEPVIGFLTYYTAYFLNYFLFISLKCIFKRYTVLVP